MLTLASAEAVAGITAGATLLAGLGLAGVTMLNQKREIKARTDGQKRQLEHTRELADLDDLRKLLDEAAVALDCGRKARANADANLLGIAEAIKSGELVGTPKRPADTLDPMIEEAADKLEEAGQPLITLGARLQVRLGRTDPITAAFSRASAALHAQWLALTDGYPRRGLEAIEEDARHAGQEFGVFAEDFLAAAVKRAGTVPTQGGRA